MQNFTKISPNLLQPRIPELGKIKIGGKGEKRTARRSQKEYRLPVKYDHFVVTTRMKDDSDNWIRDATVHEKIGKEPKELDVRLMFDEPEANFQYFLAAYDGQTKRCSGNGQVAHDREHGEIPCTCPWLKVHEGPYRGPKRPMQNAPTCKPHGRLSVVLEAAETYGGFYVFRTTSWETIRSIAAQLETFRSQFGFLAGLPLRMVIYPAKDVTPDGTFKSYKVALVVRASMDTALKLATQAHERRKMLPKGAMPEVHQAQLLESEEGEAQDIAEEFYPPEAEVVEEEGTEEEEQGEEAEKLLEDELRLTLELLEWDKQKINRQVAKYSADLSQLEEVLEEKAPKELQMARKELARVRGPEEDEDDEEAVEGGGDDATADPDDDAVEAELEPNDAEEVVVEAEVEEEAEAEERAEQESLW